MKIALYQPWIYLYGGIERSIVELVKRSRHQWTIFTGHYEPDSTFPEFAEFDVRELNCLSVKRDIASVMTAATKILFQKLPLNNFDALVIWCDGIGDMAVFRNHSLPLFNICSTPLRAAFDPVYERHALMSRGFFARILYKLFKNIFISTDRMAWRRFDGVIATSLEVKNRIIQGNLYQAGDRMQLFHPGIDWNAFDVAPRYEPMFLVPGRIMWTKNIELAISAFIKAGPPAPWRLVIAGFVDAKSQDYLSGLQELASGHDRIIFEPSPTDNRLQELYRTASAVLFPPLNEDWGIVPLEAMASSKPVMANAMGGPLESVKDGETGWLLDSSNDAWADTIIRASRNREEIRRMGRNARIRARQYDWSTFASGVDNAIDNWVRYKAYLSHARLRTA
jgi:glycosyltransferase involved in cell wall biosynthesis